MSEDKKSDYTEVHEEPRRMSEEDVKNYHGQNCWALPVSTGALPPNFPV